MYLLHNVYSSLLVTPRGGGRNCQPSWTSVQRKKNKTKERKRKIACQRKHQAHRRARISERKMDPGCYETEEELTLLILFRQLRHHFTPHSLQLKQSLWFTGKNTHYHLTCLLVMWWEVPVKGDPCAFTEKWKQVDVKSFEREIRQTDLYFWEEPLESGHVFRHDAVLWQAKCFSKFQLSKKFTM